MEPKVLVTFDVDGTILTSPGGGVTHIRAIKEAAYELYGVPLKLTSKIIVIHGLQRLLLKRQQIIQQLENN